MRYISRFCTNTILTFWRNSGEGIMVDWPTRWSLYCHWGICIFTFLISETNRAPVSLLTEIPPAKANRWPHCVENDAVRIEETIGRPALTKAKYPCQNYPLSKLPSRSSKASQIQSGSCPKASQAINTEQHRQHRQSTQSNIMATSSTGHSLT